MASDKDPQTPTPPPVLGNPSPSSTPLPDTTCETQEKASSNKQLKSREKFESLEQLKSQEKLGLGSLGSQELKEKKDKPDAPKEEKKDEKKLNLKDLIKKHLQMGACKMEYELSELHQLLDLAKASMQKMPTLVEITAPINVCGDIHGQYQDLMRIFISCGLPFKSRYLFLGDYVDRGRHSLEVIVLLLACKIKFPNNIFLLRGNHELPNINRVYGFHAELRTRYRNIPESKALYDHFNEVFSEMPLAAIVSGKILCMHGGLSPFLNSLDDIRKIKRPISVVRGLAQDLLWADPEAGVKGFQPNKVRAVSHVFGEDAVREKTKQLKIDMVIRAHQVVEFGYAFFASRQLVTIFSAARYHEDLCNYAAIVQIDERLELAFMQLKPIEFEQQKRDKVARTMDVDEGPDENDQ